MRSSLVFFTAFTLPVCLLIPGARTAAAGCTPPRVLVVVDKSSSMQTGTIDGIPKWALAVTALTDVTLAHEDDVALGLMSFPNPDACAPGKLDVAPALGTADAIALA